MLARAVALASLLGEDAAPLEVLPEPVRSAAREARRRIEAVPRPARGAAVARETVALFALPAPQIARRVLPRGLVTALSPARPRAPAPPPAERSSFLARAVAAASSLGVRALARASAPEQDGTTPTLAAEVLRRLAPDEAVALVVARRAQASLADVERSRLALAVTIALGDPAPGSLARRAGLCRVAWAASVEADGATQPATPARAHLEASLPPEDRSFAAHAAEVLWFAASEDATAERARIALDLEESA